MNQFISQIFFKNVLKIESLDQYPSLNALMMATQHIQTLESNEGQQGSLHFSQLTLNNGKPARMLNIKKRLMSHRMKRRYSLIKAILSRCSTVKVFMETSCAIQIKMPNEEPIQLIPDFLMVTKENHHIFLEVDDPSKAVVVEATPDLKRWLRKKGYLYLNIHPTQIRENDY